MSDPELEDLLRSLAPQVLGVLLRRYGSFTDAEDAVQEALIEAAARWPAAGTPREPRAWLITVAQRRLIDHWRRETARRARDERSLAVPESTGSGEVAGDDSLELFLLCCHPVLSPPSQVALTLRAVGGLTTAEIARSFLVPETTIAQRISRAKSGIRRAGARFELPAGADLVARVNSVAAVLYLIFTEGHTASSGAELQRGDLAVEAIRLTRMLLARVRAEPTLASVQDEVGSLLALMLLTASRWSARVDRTGALVPLDEQERGLWDAKMITEGVALVEAALRQGPVGPYQLQAAIAAVHAEAPSAAETDWLEILALYDLLCMLAPGPMVTLNRVVALAMAVDPEVALIELAACAGEPALAGHHRIPAIRAHLLERQGNHEAARADFLEAARLTSSDPERRYLLQRAARADAR
ncbi:MAG: RNA polymerase sigma factor [Propionicimonas sp.]